MGRKIKWSKEEDQKIKELRAQGMSWERMADELLINSKTILGRAKIIGAWTPTLTASSAKRWTEEARENLRRLAKDGKSVKQMAEELGFTKNGIISMAHTLNIPLRHRGAITDMASRTMKWNREPLPPGHPISWNLCLGMTERYPVNPQVYR